MLYDVPAPAKLNLFLHVVGRRPDGYHLLQTVFRFIDLCDTLHFEARADGRIERAAELPGVPADQDLTVRAARALQQAAGVRQGVTIGLEKRIPQGGGLGGGSSDAASTLIALNRLWNTGLSRRDLMELALPLGADVPVFVFGQAAFAEGVGEILTPVEVPERAYLIVRPAEHVSTPHVFTDPGLTRDTKRIRITVFADWLLEQRGLEQGKIQAAQHTRRQTRQQQAGQRDATQQQVAGQQTGQYAMFGRNDLEAVVRARYPKVEKALAFLNQNKIQARMTGSGACL